MRRGILANADELRALKGRISKKPFDAIYRVLRARCALILESAPVTEAQWRNHWMHGKWCAAVEAAKTTQGRIIDLLIAHHIDANGAYRDRAIEELDNLVSWSTWVDPSIKGGSADLCTAESAVAATIALDWLWDDLDETHRADVIGAIRTKAVDAYREAVGQPAWWYGCYHYWNAVVNSGCGLAALALGDEDADETCGWALDGLSHFFDALGREGGWDEGTGSWGYALRYLLLFGQSLSRLKDDQSIFHRRGMDTTGQFPIYFTPNGRPASFGDSPVVPLYGTLYLLTERVDCRQLLWWLDTYAFHRDVATSGFATAGLALLFRPPDAPAAPPVQLEPVKVFSQIGWAALADRWPKPQFYVAAKTGDLSANHSQRDMNSIQLQVDGEMLLTDLGNAPHSDVNFSDARDEFYQVQARAHNTVTVAQRDHLIDAHGRIVDSGQGKRYRWIACDAMTACGENVQFVRYVVMVVDPDSQQGHTLVVLDELVNGVPETVEIFWHTQGELKLDTEKFTGAIIGRRTALGFGLACTTRASLECHEHHVDSRRHDHVIHVSAGVIDTALFASVFSRSPLDAAPQIERVDGQVIVRCPTATVHLQREGRHLKLTSVKT